MFENEKCLRKRSDSGYNSKKNVGLLTRDSHREFKEHQAHTFFKTLYETNFYLKVYYRENTFLNSCLIISKIKKFINIFAKKSNLSEIIVMLSSNLTKKILDHKEETLRYVQEIFVTKY